MVKRNFDLFGVPVPEGWGRRGRPAHLVTDEKRNLVKVLLALGKNEDEIAAALLCTPKTLRKHYSRELAVRDQARAHVDGKILLGLWQQGEKGNVGALKKLFEIFEKHDLRKLSTTVGARRLKPEARGKKEIQAAAAKEVSNGDRFKPRPAPRIVN